MVDRRFESLVNVVRVVERPGGKIVEKRYGAVARMTGIEVPCIRYRIEARILRFLTDYLTNSRTVCSPRLLGIRDEIPLLEMTLERGCQLRDARTTEWPGPDGWFELGLRLGALDRGGIELARIALGDDWDLAEQIRGLMWSYKSSLMGATVARTGAGEVLCLGDVNLTNVLGDRNSITLIDFEAAHAGARGFDAGQLVGELEWRAIEQPAARLARASVIDGWADAGASLGDLRRWGEIFARYYARKQITRRVDVLDASAIGSQDTDDAS